MKHRPILFLFTLIIVGSLPAHAIPFTLNFGGLQNNEQVVSFYNGGTGSLGSGPAQTTASSSIQRSSLSPACRLTDQTLSARRTGCPS